jgi:hypothetical protein
LRGWDEYQPVEGEFFQRRVRDQQMPEMDRVKRTAV